MAVIRPFCAVRPAVEYADKVAALPYDVYNRAEAKKEVEREPLSFLAIDRAETQFEDSVSVYAPEVYAKAKELFEKRISQGIFIEDKQSAYYIYQLEMNGRTQTGIAACASVDDYLDGTIKKHENTREEKEQDRIRHVDTLSAQTGPIFLAYRSQATINQLVSKIMETQEPLYDFTASDGIAHRMWKVTEEAVTTLQEAFAGIQEIYIADGHHRAASAVKVGLKRRKEHPDYDGTEEFNYFLSVLFPDEELMIMDYNRVVKDLNGMSEEQFLAKMNDLFVVSQIGGTIGDALSESAVRPDKKGDFAMFIGDKWYRCSMKPSDIPNDPVEGLDVSVLQNLLLAPVLGIGDPKTDKRIDFVGGIRGLTELEKRCHTDCKVAFAMYPTSIQELFAVADADRLMPPKSTWFEPKLRSGLFIHEIEK